MYHYKNILIQAFYVSKNTCLKKHFLTFGHYNTYTTFILLYLLLHNHDFYS